MRFLFLTSWLSSLLMFGQEPLKVLTIANSFADSVFDYLPKIAASVPDCNLKLMRANIGGCSLERHCLEMDKADADPKYKPYGGGKFTLKEMLKKEKWDIVTIQQVSTYSIDFSTYEPHASRLIAVIRELAPQAEIVVQQTWAYRFDDRRLLNWGISQEEMYRRLSDAYGRLAASYGFRVIPTGAAVQLARQTQAKPYVPYDLEAVKNLKHPDPLPDETGSWVRGHSWRKDAEGNTVLGLDASHLNKRGEYLQSLVWFSFLFKRPTQEVTFYPKEVMTADEAEWIKATAQKALDTFVQPAAAAAAAAKP